MDLNCSHRVKRQFIPICIRSCIKHWHGDGKQGDDGVGKWQDNGPTRRDDGAGERETRALTKMRSRKQGGGADKGGLIKNTIDYIDNYF